MIELSTEITMRLLEIKRALADHRDTGSLERELYAVVLKAISTGAPFSTGHARVVFAVERMRLAQKEADRKELEEAEKAAAAAAAAEKAAEAARRAAQRQLVRGSTRASGAKVSPDTAVDPGVRAQGNSDLYELRKRTLAARLRGQVSRDPVE